MEPLHLVIIVLAILLALYYLFRYIFRLGYRFAIAQVMETILEERLGGDKKPAEELKIEIKDGIIYLYTVEGDEFIAQGKTLEEIGEIVTKRYPKRLFSIRKKDLDKVLKNGESV